MNKNGFCTSVDACCRLLQVCAKSKDVYKGRQIYASICKNDVALSDSLASHLIRMFAACGSLSEANEVFTKAPKASTFVWHAVISAHTNSGWSHEAIKLYAQMQQFNVVPDDYLFVAALKACAIGGLLTSGKLIHTDIVNNSLETDIYVRSTLIDMYAKCGNLQDARTLFNNHRSRNIVTWNVMIAGYANVGHLHEALVLFERMQKEDLKADTVTLFRILKACSSASSSDMGRQLHAYILEAALESDLSLSNSLIDTYTKCGKLEDTEYLFNKLPVRSVVTWNALIAGYVQQGLSVECIQLFQRMHQEGRTPDKVTCICTLKAVASLGAVEVGRLIHAYIIETIIEFDVVVANSLLDMYTKSKSLKDAGNLFSRLLRRDAVTWTVMISGYAQHGYNQEALQLFQDMKHEGMGLDNIAVAGVLKACCLYQGRTMHVGILCSPCRFDLLIGNALIDMYAKCENLLEAKRAFDQLHTRDVVTWNTIISGYVQYGLDGQEALTLFEQMQQSGVTPNAVTCASILKACCLSGALHQGKIIHTCVVESGLHTDQVIGSALINLHAECGSLEDARGVFETLSKQDVITWSAMIAGFSFHKNYILALQYFKQMRQEGLNPDSVVLVSLLSVCSHLGLIEEAYRCFCSMENEFGFRPNLEHYNCMIDLLGRAGRLHEGEKLLQSMRFQENTVGWRSLLGSCRIYGDVEVGRRCFDAISLRDAGNASAIVLMSNIYADAGMWEEVDKLKQLRKQAQAWRKPGHALIEIDDEVHSFVVGDNGHMQCTDVYVKLERLSRKFTEAGYTPQCDLVVELSAAQNVT